MADKIVKRHKVITRNVVVHLLLTAEGDSYRVIHTLTPKGYFESIWFVTRKYPVLVRQVFLPLNEIPAPNFEKFIELGALSH